MHQIDLRVMHSFLRLMHKDKHLKKSPDELELARQRMADYMSG